MKRDGEKQLIQARLLKEVVRKVDHWRIERGLTRQVAIEELLRAGLEATMK